MIAWLCFMFTISPYIFLNIFIMVILSFYKFGSLIFAASTEIVELFFFHSTWDP